MNLDHSQVNWGNVVLGSSKLTRVIGRSPFPWNQYVSAIKVIIGYGIVMFYRAPLNVFRYFYRNIHYAKIIKDGVCIQSMVKGLSDLHEQVNKLLEVPRTAYGDLHGTWWQFKET